MLSEALLPEFDHEMATTIDRTELDLGQDFAPPATGSRDAILAASTATSPPRARGSQAPVTRR